MQTFENTYFGLRLQIPDSWIMRPGGHSDAEFKALARDAARYVPPDPAAPGSACRTVRYLMTSRLNAPGEVLGCDAIIDLSAWICDDAYMLEPLEPDKPKPLKSWTVNGIEMLYTPDLALGHLSPENVHYRHARWKVGPGLWLYAHMQGTGKARMDYVLSIFETLSPLKATPVTRRKPLFEREPWTRQPSYFRMKKNIEDKLPLYDVVYDGDFPEDVQKSNQRVLDGKAAAKRWTPLSFRRRSRVRVLDCYYGPGNWIFCSGIYSDRAVQLLKPHLARGFDALPCRVDGKPYWFLRTSRPANCLDESASLIKRFDDGSIMTIERYRFDGKQVPDPALFAIPQERHVLVVTASVAQQVRDAKLTGIALHPIDGAGREVTCPG